jgi:hypothetical protein
LGNVARSRDSSFTATTSRLSGSRNPGVLAPVCRRGPGGPCLRGDHSNFGRAGTASRVKGRNLATGRRLRRAVLNSTRLVGRRGYLSLSAVLGRAQRPDRSSDSERLLHSSGESRMAPQLLSQELPCTDVPAPRIPQTMISVGPVSTGIKQVRTLHPRVYDVPLLSSCGGCCAA